MARPRKTTQSTRIDIVLTLTEGIDDDLITLFKSLPRRHRPQVVKAALRGQAQITIEATEPTEDDTDFLADLAF